MRIWMIAIIMIFFFFGYHQAIACEKLKANELSNLRIQFIYRQNPIHISLEEKNLTLKVQHEVKGNDVYIECIVSNFTFNKENESHQEGEGHLILYIDGQKVDELFQPAFIAKGLPSGTHRIKLEFVRNDRQPYGLVEEFSVVIP